MALTADQNATLQLLLERGQSYPDLAKLLAVDEAEVRARARAALTELAGADPDRNLALTDYLLGQADPIGRADAVRHLRDDPEDLRLAQELLGTLRSTYPNAELPRLPGEARPPRRPRGRGDREGGGLSLPSLSSRQARLAAILAAGGLVLVVIVLAIAGVFSGDDESSGAGETTTSESSADGEEIERVVLSSPGGGDATGEALFGLTDSDQAFLDLSIEGLDPTPNDQTYVVWLLLDQEQGYPLTPLAVSDNGSFADRFAIPSAVLPIVARVRFVDVSIAPVAEVRSTIRRALQDEQLVLEKPGETVLEGTVPRLAEDGGGE